MFGAVRLSEPQSLSSILFCKLCLSASAYCWFQLYPWAIQSTLVFLSLRCRASMIPWSAGAQIHSAAAPQLQRLRQAAVWMLGSLVAAFSNSWRIWYRRWREQHRTLRDNPRTYWPSSPTSYPPALSCYSRRLQSSPPTMATADTRTRWSRLWCWSSSPPSAPSAASRTATRPRMALFTTVSWLLQGCGILFSSAPVSLMSAALSISATMPNTI